MQRKSYAMETDFITRLFSFTDLQKITVFCAKRKKKKKLFYFPLFLKAKDSISFFPKVIDDESMGKTSAQKDPYCAVVG